MTKQFMFLTKNLNYALKVGFLDCFKKIISSTTSIISRIKAWVNLSPELQGWGCSARSVNGDISDHSTLGEFPLCNECASQVCVTSRGQSTNLEISSCRAKPCIQSYFEKKYQFWYLPSNNWMVEWYGYENICKHFRHCHLPVYILCRIMFKYFGETKEFSKFLHISMS